MESNKLADKVQYVNTTPKGHKKDVFSELTSGYDPIMVESAWYDWWEASGFFKPEVIDQMSRGYTMRDNPNGKFVIVIPPPNVTGALHLGHALTNSIQDTLVRYHRMKGKTVLWVPGCDHAGIATQVVVEKKLMREENKTRHDIGREEFVKRIWDWKADTTTKIYDQIKALGASLDWDRAVFTMDPKMIKAVKAAFITMHNKGMIKRQNRMVNWSVPLKSAISDLEVDRKELTGKTMLPIVSHGGKSYEFGVMTHFAYKVEGTDEEIVIATTRPETILGDVCVAVHPEDKRWKHLHGKSVVHAFNGQILPIILDGIVDMEKGTGALKITPGHDRKDFDVGQRHNLPVINILNDDGTMNEVCGKFAGMKRYECRNAIVKELKEMKLFREAVSHAMVIPICSRTKDVVEDVVRPQWFVDCDTMGARAEKAVIDCGLDIIPGQHKTTWSRFLENTSEWCISRQLWWGHRIPAYKIVLKDRLVPDNEDAWVICDTEEEALIEARKRHTDIDPNEVSLLQDPDVLDTWFSSGLFPFSCMGWPDNTPDFQDFFPGTLLETGHDILFFWVARMVMMSLALTDKLPFDTVYLHAMVRDAHGRKMSKSLGNVIDPMNVITGIPLEALQQKLMSGNLDPKEVKIAKASQKTDYPAGIPECGTDALRFTLCAYTMGGKDVNLDVNRIVANRHFCNKVWNAYKMFYFYCKDFIPNPDTECVLPTSKYTTVDRWIISKLSNTVTVFNREMDAYNFTKVTDAILYLWKDCLCDVYLEFSKNIFKAGDKEAIAIVSEVLYTCIEIGLRLLHPVMPFLTEELWQRLPRRENVDASVKSIMISSFPTEAFCYDAQLEEAQEQAMDVVRAIRKCRNMYLELRERPTVKILIKNSQFESLITPFHDMIVALAELGELHLVKETFDKKGYVSDVYGNKAEIYVLVAGLVDTTKEIAKIEKKMSKVRQSIEKAEKKLSGLAGNKVPEHVLSVKQEELNGFKSEMEGLLETKGFYESM